MATKKQTTQKLELSSSQHVRELNQTRRENLELKEKLKLLEDERNLQMSKCRQMKRQLDHAIAERNSLVRINNKDKESYDRFDKMCIGNDVELDFILNDEESEKLICYLIKNEYCLVKHENKILFSYSVGKE